MNKALSKNFFLISFLPAIAYWYLEANYPIKIAIIGGLILAIAEIIFEYVYTKHIHTMSKFNFFLLLGLGGVSLLGDDGIWFKLQPAFTGVGISLFLFYRLFKGKGLLAEMSEMMPNKQALPPFIMESMEKHVSVLFFLYGIFMIFVAMKLSTDRWLFFKTIGFYLVFGIFMIFEIIFIRIKVKKMFSEKEAKYENE